MRTRSKLLSLVLGLFSGLSQQLYAQQNDAGSPQIDAPQAQPGSVSGQVTDADEALIPGAQIAVEGPNGTSQITAAADQSGEFRIAQLPAGVALQVTVTAQGFSTWRSAEVTLAPGQALTLTGIKLTVANVETAVSAVFADQLATLQVKNEEQQRVFGFIPNFYTSYDPTFVPLGAKLKYKLAFKAITDPVNVVAAAFVGALDQASDAPDYHQGWAGYGQRVGAIYANGASDILIGGAVLPSLLHQDPRYFYQGTGTKKSRALHALESPFLCKGDNGREQVNYSSIGGDLASGALSNLYYPDSNRGAGLVFSNAAGNDGWPHGECAAAGVSAEPVYDEGQELGEQLVAEG